VFCVPLSAVLTALLTCGKLADEKLFRTIYAASQVFYNLYLSGEF